MRRVGPVGEVGYVSYGPLVAADVPREQVVPRLVEGLDRHRPRALFVQPVDHDDVSRGLLGAGFRGSSAGVAPASTIRIDLSPDEDRLRAGLSKRNRRWTGRWADAGVTVRRGGRADLDLLTSLIGRSAAHQGFAELSPEYVRRLYDRFAPSGHAETFVGEVHGHPVAAELFTACGGVLRCRLTGRTATRRPWS
ncbi:MAG TPA: GNAT family N-acetyltransferase [Pseudonocardia sp.]